MWRPSQSIALVASFAAGLALPACFDGDVTVGASCERDTQCGADQNCTNGVCGRCGDGKVDEGEVCFGAATEKALPGDVATMLVFPFVQGMDALLLAVNGDCRDFGAGPMSGPCWGAVLAVPDGEGDVDIIGPEETASVGQGHVDQIAVGDFDGDDATDVAAALGDLNQIQVITSVESTSGSVQTIDFGMQRPTTVYAADLNGDGFDDLVGGTQLFPEVGVSLSDGDGTFGPLQTYPAGAIPRVARPTDVDGDGDLDLVVVGVGDDESLASFVSVLRGDGQGSFAEAELVPLAVAVLPWATALGDLDGDGNEDLVVSLLTSFPGSGEGTDGFIAVLLGDGAGGFGEPETYPTGKSPLFVALRDINGDTRLDVLVANADDDKVSYYLNGVGGDTLLGDQQQLDVSLGPIAILAVHLDRNEVEDLAVANVSGSLSVSFADF